MNIATAKSLKIIKGLPPKAVRGDKISLDTEFFGQEKKKLHRPHGQFAFLGASFDGETVFYITDESEIQEFMDRLEDGVWIFHNAKYDIRQLRRFALIPQRKNLWDTLLVEQIMFSGYYSEFALNDLVRRYCDTYMSKEVRKEFSDTAANEMTKEQIEYAAIDVAYTWHVFSHQRKNISDSDLQIWRTIELPFLWTLLAMSGVKLDTEKWLALAKKNQETAKEIQAKYPEINLNSPAQVKNKLAELGYKRNSTNIEVLDELSDECEFAKDMCVYRTFQKRSSTYGEKFVEDYVEADGKIYADIYQIGAETSRTSCRAPNLQNQPHENAYRDCFIADDGEAMIVADWSSQEPKFAAHFSEDDGLIDALNSEEKLYVRIAREALDIHITKSSPEYKHLKSTVLGLFYGMSAKGLAKRIGVSEEKAQHMIDSILETYPDVKEYMKRQKRAKDYVTSVSNRKVWLNKYSFQWERNALNAPIQSSAAEAMKLAASKFVAGAKNTWRLVLLIHDEICVACPISDVKDVMKYLEDCMVSVANELHPQIRGAVEIFNGKSWACKS